MLVGVLEDVLAGALHPAGVVQRPAWARAACRAWGTGSQHASNRTNITPILCFSAICQELVHPLQKPFAVLLPEQVVQEDAHALKPSASAQPSSRSMVAGSKVSACHISSWLIAVPGVVAADEPTLFSSH